MRLSLFAFSLLAATCLLTGCSSSSHGVTMESDAVASAEDAVRAVLAQQVEAWNAGSVRGFMDGYARTDSLRFASGGTVRRGWQAALDGYERGYPDRSAMGSLSFDSLDVRVLDARWAVVFGRWQLQRAEDAPGGLFTLLFERRAEGWRIVHDHTSSAD